MRLIKIGALVYMITLALVGVCLMGLLISGAPGPTWAVYGLTSSIPLVFIGGAAIVVGALG